MGVALSIHESKRKRFFHGKLFLQVIEAKNLPNLDFSFFGKDLTDPYVTVIAELEGEEVTTLAKTRVFDDNLNPYWGEQFQIQLCHVFDTLKFEVKDKDTIGVDRVGELCLAANDLFMEKHIQGWFPLKGIKRNNGSLCVSARFVPIGDNRVNGYAVPDVPFPLRTGCSVTLYQDAHTPAEPPLTDIKDGYGNSYKPPQLWVDISNALENAKKLIYIVGWSVKTNISLKRSGENDELLGDLLRRKADEGVRVLIMIWDEPLSNDLLPGMMGIHDEETHHYFRGTNVHLLKTCRDASTGNFLRSIYHSAIFSHHQKCIIVDTECAGRTNLRKLTVFQGGIDVSGGRWDTPEHCIYKTLDHEHKHDFYNKVDKTLGSAVGPRQPWHDIHQKIEGGRITLDILNNFVSRWLHQAPAHEKDVLASLSQEDFDFDWVCSDVKLSLSQPQEASSPRNSTSGNMTSWNVQFFRSINSDSVTFSKEILNTISFCKGKGYDDSIQQAYIHHIRRAKKFIYIENQYFLGSSYAWKAKYPQSPNVIPIELTARIVDSIASGKEFRVYVVIPLHSEGDPKSPQVQEMLYWQYNTMQMMYSKIGKAIAKAKIKARPIDYLSFFCLTKRENPNDRYTRPGKHLTPTNKSLPNRHMIYVHSKMILFDDEYIIVGSANINERSMEGNRDSEMACGAYQSKTFSNLDDAMDNGNVHIFRLALWAEHCGVHLPEHMNPTSLKCMKVMNDIGAKNLERYLKSDTNHSESHLMSYPLKVNQDGKLTKLRGWTTFPDSGGKICGANSTFLPNTLTA